MNCRNNKLLFLFCLLLAAFISPANAISFQTITSGSIQERDEVATISGDNLFLYDKVQSKFIHVVNLNNPARLRIALMDTSLGVEQILRPPNTSKFEAYTIEAVDFYPTEIINKELKNGMLVFHTNKGFITVDIVTHEAQAFRFTSNFFEGRYGEIPFTEFSKARTSTR